VFVNSGRPGPDNKIDNLAVPEHCSKHERCFAAPVVSIDIGAGFKQKFGNGRLALKGNTTQRCLAMVVVPVIFQGLSGNEYGTDPRCQRSVDYLLPVMIKLRGTKVCAWVSMRNRSMILFPSG
jgi:hypothetical protein